MPAMLVVGLLFLAGVAYNVFGPEPNPSEAIVGAVIAAILIGLFFITRYHHKQAAEFERWLTQNSTAIERGGALYQNEILITPATRLTRYQVAISFLIVSFKIPTRSYVVGHHATGLVAAACILISIGFGWWGIPWGPIYTVQVIRRNLRGGVSQTVAELATLSTGVRAGPHVATGAVDHDPRREARVK